MSQHLRLTRRQLLKASAAGAGMAVARSVWGQSLPATAATAASPSRSPNIIFVSTDQHSLEALSAHGCKHVRTPNIDRLIRGGVSFQQSYTTDPVCSPARSSWFTGRMPSETGVIRNGLPIRQGMPTMGQLLRDSGYQTYYCGKWHVPNSYSSSIPGFDVLPAGITGQGHFGDTAVSQTCQALLEEQRAAEPFLLVASILQPHDICAWIADNARFPIQELPFGLKESDLPDLPANLRSRPDEPKGGNRPNWSDLQWRYYLWAYDRHVEMADAEIGRILDALESSPHARNTIVIFTSDHGESQGEHGLTMKNNLYEGATKVPLVVWGPDHVRRGARDEEHLVSGADIMPTICDYAGVAVPAKLIGRSLRPLVENRQTSWRDHLAAEATITGRMLRTPRYKYVTYKDHPVEQLFDLKADPGETRNLAADNQLAAVLDDHRKLLRQWESRLDVAPPPPAAPGDQAPATDE